MSKKSVHVWQQIKCPNCDHGTVVSQFWEGDGLLGPVRYDECERCQGMGYINVSQKEAKEIEQRRNNLR